jgi:hypothetical protein
MKLVWLGLDSIYKFYERNKKAEKEKEKEEIKIKRTPGNRFGPEQK